MFLRISKVIYKMDQTEMNVSEKFDHTDEQMLKCEIEVLKSIDHKVKGQKTCYFIQYFPQHLPLKHSLKRTKEKQKTNKQ